MFCARGPGQGAFRKQWFGPLGDRMYPVLGEFGLYNAPFVGQYRHIGGLLHHAGDLKQDAKRRIAIAHQTFTQHRKPLFQNKAISRGKPTTCSDVLYLANCFTVQNLGCFQIRKPKAWYTQRSCAFTSDSKLLDDQVLDQLGLPSPSELLRVSRLRYLRTLVASGHVVQWGLLNMDHNWVCLVADDLKWIVEKLWNSEALRTMA